MYPAEITRVAPVNPAVHLSCSFEVGRPEHDVTIRPDRATPEILTRSNSPSLAAASKPTETSMA